LRKPFALQFNNLEWECLCSYQWFLTGMDRALETGDFSAMQSRAEQTPVDDKIRPRWKGTKHLRSRISQNPIGTASSFQSGSRQVEDEDDDENEDDLVAAMPRRTPLTWPPRRGDPGNVLRPFERLQNTPSGD
jgi:hypothetical protein